MDAIGGNAVPIYLSVVGNEATTAAKVEAGNGSVQQAIAHFKTAAADIRTPAALLKDYRSLSVVLGAFGMSSMSGETAILQKLMTQNPSSSTSLAATSNNPTWQSFAKAMSGWSDGQTPLSSATAIGKIAAGYVTASFETSEGNQYAGLGTALDFTRSATGITSINALMSNSTLLNVAEVDSGLDPDQFGALDFDQQKAILTKDVDLKDYATTKGVQRMAEQYLALTAENPPPAAAPSGVLSLFSSSSNNDSLFGIIGAELSANA